MIIQIALGMADSLLYGGDNLDVLRRHVEDESRVVRRPKDES